MSNIQTLTPAVFTDIQRFAPFTTGYGPPTGVVDGLAGQIYMDITNPALFVLWFKPSSFGDSDWQELGGSGGGANYYAGTGLTLTGTTFSVNYGTTSTTAAAGNDSRLALAATALQAANLPAVSSTTQIYGGSGTAGQAAVITLGTNLSITAGVLNATGGGGSSTTGAIVNSGTATTMTTNILEIGTGVGLPFSATLPTTPTQWAEYKVYNATGSVGPINVLGTINNASGTITINSVGGAATFFYDGTQYCRTA